MVRENNDRLCERTPLRRHQRYKLRNGITLDTDLCTRGSDTDRRHIDHADDLAHGRASRHFACSNSSGPGSHAVAFATAYARTSRSVRCRFPLGTDGSSTRFHGFTVDSNERDRTVCRPQVGHEPLRFVRAVYDGNVTLVDVRPTAYAPGS